MATPSKILIAPLDWGLGHTTRCIPIIRYLIAQGNVVYAAAEGASARLLRENFPDINLLPLEGYRIAYSRNRKMFTLKILMQVPKILSAIRKERNWLQQQQQIHRFDLILSDNRYGLYHDQVCSVILTHQLQIMSGSGRLADAILRRLHYRLLSRFRQCWVVDEEMNGGLSGQLAHPQIVPEHAAYTGVLSQFSGSPVQADAVQDNRILILLSGPEPMRGQLEQILMGQIKTLRAYQFVVVAGNPLGKPAAHLPGHIVYHTHLNAEHLLPELQKASLVICRSGYSTVMDLAVLSKKALLIPTPGQTEQEYLAQYLTQQHYFRTCNQEDLHLEIQIPEALQATYRAVSTKGSRIRALLDSVLTGK